MAAFFKKYRRDVVYWVVIAGLAGWIIYNQNNRSDQALFSELGRSLNIAINHQDIRIMQLVNEINREADLYPTKQNTHYAENARRTKSNISNAIEQLDKIGYPLFIEPKYEEGQLGEITIQQIKVALRALADTLASYTDDELFTAQIYRILYSDSASYAAPKWACLSAGSFKSSRVGAGWANLRYRVFFAELVAMNYWHSPQDRIIDEFWKPIPIMSTPRTVLRPGEWFEADIFLTAFPPRTDFVSVYVDDKPIAIVDRVAPYRQRFNTPGLKKIDVKIELTNPLTKEVETFHKTFEVLVVEPCPELR